MNTKRTCQNCGKIFEIKKGESSKKAYCSLDCKKDMKNKRRKKTPIKIEKKCLYCGKPFVITSRGLTHKKFCSRECYRKYEKENKRKYPPLNKREEKTCIEC